MKSNYIKLLLLLFISFYSCDNALECAFGIEPEINENSVAPALLDQNYFQLITAEVDNAANDNAYDYFFRIEGDIPDGIDIFFFPREIEFSGVPSETGRFNFRIFLSVERFDFDTGLYDRSPTCSNEISKNFALEVFE
ncbi:hypothetical protein [uncultured Winogradskyella sp.]|jgi:hypothetical protein|uniref:hypothetical protein n=1 Tax=uncultured Winogradskyella sp. TaxID=395353 RepID=UPI0025FFFB03|nr:hypothetical protein [uncultured Winogradskyella sp.]